MSLSLLINVDEIPDPGLTIAGDLPPEWVAATLLEAYTCTAPVTVQVEAKRYHDNIHVSGQVHAKVAFECSRTLAPGEMVIEATFNELFSPADAAKLNLGEGLTSEDLDADEVWSYEGNKLDLEPLIRQELVMAQEPYPVLSDEPTDGPAWTDTSERTDPRWAALADIVID